MKDVSLRELSQQYAAGKLSFAQYRQMRQALLDGITVMADEKVSFPDYPPAPIPAESDCRDGFSAKAFLVWFLAVICTVIMLYIVWNLPDENEIMDAGQPLATSDSSSLPGMMSQPSEVAAKKEEKPSPHTFRPIPVLQNTKYRALKAQKLKTHPGGRGR